MKIKGVLDAEPSAVHAIEKLCVGVEWWNLLSSVIGMVGEVDSILFFCAGWVCVRGNVSMRFDGDHVIFILLFSSPFLYHAACVSVGPELGAEVRHVLKTCCGSGLSRARDVVGSAR